MAVNDCIDYELFIEALSSLPHSDEQIIEILLAIIPDHRVRRAVSESRRLYKLDDPNNPVTT